MVLAALTTMAVAMAIVTEMNKPRAMDVVAAMNGAKITREAAEMKISGEAAEMLGMKATGVVAATNRASVMARATEMYGTRGMVVGEINGMTAMIAAREAGLLKTPAVGQQWLGTSE